MEGLAGFEKEIKKFKTSCWWESQFKMAHCVSNFIILNVTRSYFF